MRINNKYIFLHLVLLIFTKGCQYFWRAVALSYVSYVRAPAHCQGGVSRERVSYVTFAKMKRSIPSGAQGRKRRKEEEEKKAKYRGKSSHLSNYGVKRNTCSIVHHLILDVSLLSLRLAIAS